MNTPDDLCRHLQDTGRKDFCGRCPSRFFIRMPQAWVDALRNCARCQCNCPTPTPCTNNNPTNCDKTAPDGTPIISLL